MVSSYHGFTALGLVLFHLLAKSSKALFAACLVGALCF
jgi:hypothetical protein